jgi:GNAT superfamily N-acetyltransferase
LNILFAGRLANSLPIAKALKDTTIIDLEIIEPASADGLWDLLLLADPSRQMVESYLADGRLFSASWDGVIVGVFVLVPADETLWELKNIAVSEEWQGKGVGRALLASAIDKARDLGAEKLEVGTGNSSIDQIAFYQKAGFRMTRVAKNYFTLNYDEPIYENGIQCRDMLIFTLEL